MANNVEYIHHDFKYAPADVVKKIIKKYMKNFSIKVTRGGFFFSSTYDKQVSLAQDRDITGNLFKSWLYGEPNHISDYWFPKPLHTVYERERYGSDGRRALNKAVKLADDSDIFGSYLRYDLENLKDNNGEQLNARIAIYDSESLEMLLGELTDNKQTEVVVRTNSSDFFKYIPAVLEKIAKRDRTIVSSDPFHDV
ncbi:MAG: hypothetical protein ABH824_03600 [Nanoarchaeota archaeon]|nr:hypothetical protein [Nanoarchaeota archaeon]MBU1632384.1 hypothetical protein [Nanoarchaeota archaeon]MBU1876688.1 hypothetical protein [Nanoarchaeota archaeon]